MLTGKQEKFVQGLLAGLSQVEAYRAAYDTQGMNPRTIQNEAYQLAKQDKIRQRLSQLREKIAGERILTIQERMRWLTELIENDGPSNTDKLKALDMMNKMDGTYVQKPEAEVQTEMMINIELVDDED